MAVDFASGATTLLSTGAGPTVQLTHLSGYVAQPSYVAFHARMTTGTVATSTNILFNVADFNVGSGYATGTGRFTAPVAGYYHFRGSIYLPATVGDYRIYLFRNAGVEPRRQTIYYKSGTGNHSLYVESVLYLALNDYMNVHYTGPASLSAETTGMINFSGHLIG